MINTYCIQISQPFDSAPCLCLWHVGPWLSDLWPANVFFQTCFGFTHHVARVLSWGESLTEMVTDKPAVNTNTCCLVIHSPSTMFKHV